MEENREELDENRLIFSSRYFLFLYFSFISFNLNRP